MGLADIFRKINEWGANERNDRAGLGKDWQAAQAAELQRVLQRDEEERQAKREERQFRQQQQAGAAAETRAQHRRDMLEKYGQHASSLLTFDPKADPAHAYTMPDEDPGMLQEYTDAGISPSDLADMRRRALGAKALAFQESQYGMEQKSAAEKAKDERELEQQIANEKRMAGIARGTHASDRQFDIDHPLPERDGKPYDYVAEGARLAAQAHASRGDGKPPTPEEILASAEAVRASREQFERNQRASKWRAQGDPLFAGTDQPHDFAPPSAGGGPKIGDVKAFPNGRKGKWDGHGWAPI
jgi:hypothetical protein